MNGIKNSLFVKIFIWVPAILMAGTIFGFSTQNADESQGLSNRVASYIVDAGKLIGVIDCSEDEKNVYIERLQTPVRKGAHMTEYAILGCLILLALLVDGVIFKLGLIVSFPATFIFACTDEFHQTFVPGRAGRFTDVLIDSAGCLIGLIIIKLIHDKQVRYHSRNHE